MSWTTLGFVVVDRPAEWIAAALSEGVKLPSQSAGGEAASVSDERSIFGPFQIDAVLGESETWTSYRAYDSTLNRMVALKVPPPEFHHDDIFARRLQQDTRRLATLQHPHIVPLYASGVAGGIPWLTMQLLTGGNLRTLMNGGPRDVRRTVEIIRAAASALDYAHARGVVHGNLKPSNILLDDAGQVRVSDFSLAHLMAKRLVQTRTDFIAGTPHYMAPEQGLGEEADHRADIYSLGIVAYEMLTGRPPYDADSPAAVLTQHATAPFPVPAKGVVPEAAVPVLRKALAKDPSERWSTATEFARALERCIAGPAVVLKVAEPGRFVNLMVNAIRVVALLVAAVVGLDYYSPGARPGAVLRGAVQSVATKVAALPSRLGAPPVTGESPSGALRAGVSGVTTPGTLPGRTQIEPAAAATPPPAGRAVSRFARDPNGSPTAEAASPVAIPRSENGVTQPVQAREVNATNPPRARTAQSAPVQVAVCHWNDLFQVEDQQHLPQRDADRHVATHNSDGDRDGWDYYGECDGRFPA